MPGQDWLANVSGKLFSNNTLSRKLRAMGQPMVRYRQFCSRDPQYGKRSGQILLFDKIGNITAPVTGGAIIGLGETIPRYGFPIAQGQCVAYPSGAAIPWMEEFETFSEFEVRGPISSRLSDHQVKAIDWRAYQEFISTKVQYTPTGPNADTPEATWATATTTPGAAATRNVQVWDLKNVIDAMKKGNYGGSAASAQVEPWDGTNYVSIGGVDYMRALKDDPDWEKAQYYGDPEKLFSGEVGRIYTTRNIEDNHLASTLGNTGYKGEAVVFGADPVMEIVAVMEEVRQAIPGDFGRDNALAWYYLGGFKVMWEYGTTWGNGATELDNRIVSIAST